MPVQPTLPATKITTTTSLSKKFPVLIILNAVAMRLRQRLLNSVTQNSVRTLVTAEWPEAAVSNAALVRPQSARPRSVSRIPQPVVARDVVQSYNAVSTGLPVAKMPLTNHLLQPSHASVPAPAHVDVVETSAEDPADVLVHRLT